MHNRKKYTDIKKRTEMQISEVTVFNGTGKTIISIRWNHKICGLQTVEALVLSSKSYICQSPLFLGLDSDLKFIFCLS